MGMARLKYRDNCRLPLFECRCSAGQLRPNLPHLEPNHIFLFTPLGAQLERVMGMHARSVVFGCSSACCAIYSVPIEHAVLSRYTT